MKPNVGDRVRITGTLPHDPNPLPIGLEGTVDYIGQWTSDYTKQIGVAWDNGSRLLLLHDDPFVVV